jgi:hypothetical protein
MRTGWRSARWQSGGSPLGCGVDGPCLLRRLGPHGRGGGGGGGGGSGGGGGDGGSGNGRGSGGGGGGGGFGGTRSVGTAAHRPPAVGKFGGMMSASEVVGCVGK